MAETRFFASRFLYWLRTFLRELQAHQHSELDLVLVVSLPVSSLLRAAFFFLILVLRATGPFPGSFIARVFPVVDPLLLSCLIPLVPAHEWLNLSLGGRISLPSLIFRALMK